MNAKLIFRFWMMCAGLAVLFPQSVSSSESSRLMERFHSLATFESRFTQEKVYVHLDNNAYIIGETIWFKVYVVRASTLVPSAMSKTAYVELYSPEGQLIDRKVVKLTNGMGHGNFNMQESVLLHSGYYEVRAFTRAMLNWPGTEYSRVIPIYDTNEQMQKGYFLSLPPITEAPTSMIIGSSRPATAPYMPPQAESKDNYVLSFFPEGGNRVNGLPSRIAYKLTNDKGAPLTESCTLFDGSGQALSSFRPFHEGMGLFAAPPSASYVEVGSDKVRFPLPESAPTGCVMAVSYKPDGIDLQITASDAFSSRLLGLSVMCRGLACYLDTVSLKEKVSHVFIKNAIMRSGINQITLFTPDGQVVAERLVWKPVPRETLPVLTLAQNRDVFQAFSPILLHFDLKNGKGAPQRGVFSLAVTDKDSRLVDRTSHIQTDLLLTSDLRGYISNPAYYFESDDSTHAAALDNLLMVQGWRRYDWKQLAEVDSFRFEHPVEDGLLVDGYIQDMSRKRVPQKGISVSLTLMTSPKVFSGSCVSDTFGRFSMKLPSFNGLVFGQFDLSKDAKLKRYRLVLNTYARPELRGYDPQELQFSLAKKMEAAKVQSPKLFEWTDTFTGRVIALPAAKITAKKRQTDYASGRFNWLGGEETGIKHANIYYNMEDELDEIVSKGDGVPTVWEWLKSKNKDFDYDLDDSTVNCYYKKRPITVMINNVPLDSDNTIDPMALFCYDLKSVIITKPGFYLGETYLGDEAIFLYSQPEPSVYEKEFKGVELRYLRGYSVPDEFYSPNYYGADMPTRDDYSRTLYWGPNVYVDKEGKAQVSFFSNARDKSHIAVSVRGFAEDGMMLDADW